MLVQLRPVSSRPFLTKTVGFIFRLIKLAYHNCIFFNILFPSPPSYHMMHSSNHKQHLIYPLSKNGLPFSTKRACGSGDLHLPRNGSYCGSRRGCSGPATFTSHDRPYTESIAGSVTFWDNRIPIHTINLSCRNIRSRSSQKRPLDD